jgi:ABC-type branched-subunit amino acid transport system ATPase component
VFAGLPVEKNLLLGAYARPWDARTRAGLDEVYELFPVLGTGRVIADGTPAEVARAPQVVEAYLGDSAMSEDVPDVITTEAGR